MAKLLSRSHDADAINAVMNDPAVRPFVGAPGLQPIDFASVAKNDQVIFLMGEHGGFAIDRPLVDCWSIHVFIKPSGRGAWGFAAVREAFAWLAEHGIRKLIALVDIARPEVALFARRAGMAPTDANCELLGRSLRIYHAELA